MSERVSISRLDPSACSGLVYAGVPTKAWNAVNTVFSVSFRAVALAIPKSMTLGTGGSVVQAHQDVGGLDVPMDDPFLVGVLDRLTDLDEQPQSLARAQDVFVAELVDSGPAHQFHHEVRPSGSRGASVVDARDMGVIHQRQGLTFRLEPGHNGPGVHSQLEDLEGDSAVDRLFLFGHVHRAAASLADFLKEPVSADPVPRLLGWRFRAGREVRRPALTRSGNGGCFEEGVLLVMAQEVLHGGAHGGSARAHAVQKRRSRLRPRLLDGLEEDFSGAGGRGWWSLVRHRSLCVAGAVPGVNPPVRGGRGNWTAGNGVTRVGFTRTFTRARKLRNVGASSRAIAHVKWAFGPRVGGAVGESAN